MALHSRWSGGDLIFYDGTNTTMQIKKDTGGVYFGTSLADPAMNDGYGLAVEVNAVITGTSTGRAAAFSSWLNIDAVLSTAANNSYEAQTVGIYEGTATITDSNLIFGMRMQAILKNTDFSKLCAFDLNTGTSTITALFNVGSPGGEIGWLNGTTGGSLLGTVPFMVDKDDVVRYIKLWDSS